MRLRDRRRLGKYRARVWAANRKLLQRYKGSHLRWSDWRFREYLNDVFDSGVHLRSRRVLINGEFMPGGPIKTGTRIVVEGKLDLASDATAMGSSVYRVTDMRGKTLLEG